MCEPFWGGPFPTHVRVVGRGISAAVRCFFMMLLCHTFTSLNVDAVILKVFWLVSSSRFDKYIMTSVSRRCCVTWTHTGVFAASSSQVWHLSTANRPLTHTNYNNDIKRKFCMFSGPFRPPQTLLYVDCGWFQAEDVSAALIRSWVTTKQPCCRQKLDVSSCGWSSTSQVRLLFFNNDEFTGVTHDI